MKTFTYTLAVTVFLGTASFAPLSEGASLELDCQLYTSSSTWEWRHLCWIDVDAWPDEPGVDYLAISSTIAGTAYYPIPSWSNSITPSATGSSAGPITRFQELGSTWMNAYVSINSWSAKYKTANFNDPYLWAPARLSGLFSYRENGVWYLYSGPEVPPTREDNFCAGCGSSGIAYPGTP